MIGRETENARRRNTVQQDIRDSFGSEEFKVSARKTTSLRTDHGSAPVTEFKFPNKREATDSGLAGFSQGNPKTFEIGCRVQNNISVTHSHAQ